MADNDDATLEGAQIPQTNILAGEDLFQGISVECLLDWRRMAQEEIMTGVLQSVSSGDSTATRFAKIRPEARIRLINKTLWLRDPNKFPMNQPVKRTRPFYTFG
jgi:hypothetical protein